jgi:hypothetical protein
MYGVFGPSTCYYPDLTGSKALFTDEDLCMAMGALLWGFKEDKLAAFYA